MTELMLLDPENNTPLTGFGSPLGKRNRVEILVPDSWDVSEQVWDKAHLLILTKKEY